MRAILASTVWIILCGAAALGCGGGDDDDTSTSATESAPSGLTTTTEPATTAATESTESADPGAAGGDAQAILDDLSATARSAANCVDITGQEPVDGECLAAVLDDAQAQASSLADRLGALVDSDDPACATAAEEAKAGAESLEADLRALADQAANDPSGITTAALTELATGQAGTASRVADALTACATS